MHWPTILLSREHSNQIFAFYRETTNRQNSTHPTHHMWLESENGDQREGLARNFIWSSEQHQPWSWLELCASRVLILISTLRDNPHVAYDPKLLFQVRFFDGSKLIKNKVGGLFFLSWFNLMRFKITFSPPCYSFKVLEFADRRERVKICPPTKTLTSLQALRGLWSIHYHNCRKNLEKSFQEFLNDFLIKKSILLIPFRSWKSCQSSWPLKETIIRNTLMSDLLPWST